VARRIVEYRAAEQMLGIFSEARWQSGHAAACKAVYAGSIPTLASNYPLHGGFLCLKPLCFLFLNPCHIYVWCVLTYYDG
jgi:hypothetical protein